MKTWSTLPIIAICELVSRLVVLAWVGGRRVDRYERGRGGAMAGS